jgi:hypothetical protein
MRNTPPSPERNTNWLGRAAIIALLSIGSTACQSDQQKSQAEVAEGASIKDIKAIESARKALEQYESEKGEKANWSSKDIAKSEVYRLGDDGWDAVFARAILNSTNEFPAARSARPENTTVVYITTSSGSGICLALDERTGAFISMDGDN